jgi:hypothetical protein
MANTRTPRDSETRDKEKRTESWKPPNTLPDPTPREGVEFRWVRTATLGESDPANVSMRFREGWRPVRLEEVPELHIQPDKNSQNPEHAEIGGLMLCVNTTENVNARQEFYEEKARQQIDGADHAFMRESDPRMPVLKTQRTTRVSKKIIDD